MKDYVVILQSGMQGQFAPRGLWENEVVAKLIPGVDGLPRKVELRLSGQRKLLISIHKLFLGDAAEELKGGLG